MLLLSENFFFNLKLYSRCLITTKHRKYAFKNENRKALYETLDQSTNQNISQSYTINPNIVFVFTKKLFVRPYASYFHQLLNDIQISYI